MGSLLAHSTSMTRNCFGAPVHETTQLCGMVRQSPAGKYSSQEVIVSGFGLLAEQFRLGIITLKLWEKSGNGSSGDSPNCAFLTVIRRIFTREPFTSSVSFSGSPYMVPFYTREHRLETSPVLFHQSDMRNKDISCFPFLLTSRC